MVSAHTAVTEDILHSSGVPHFAYLPVSERPSPGPLRPADGVTASLAGRYSCDYYGACVTVGLAPRR